MAHTMTDQELLNTYKELIIIQKRKANRAEKMAASYNAKHYVEMRRLRDYEYKLQLLESKMKDLKADTPPLPDYAQKVYILVDPNDDTGNDDGIIDKVEMTDSEAIIYNNNLRKNGSDRRWILLYKTKQ